MQPSAAIRHLHLRSNLERALLLCAPSKIKRSRLPPPRGREGLQQAAVIAPDYGDGIIDIPSDYAFGGLPHKINRGYIQSWNFTIQKELAAETPESPLQRHFTVSDQELDAFREKNRPTKKRSW